MAEVPEIADVAETAELGDADMADISLALDNIESAPDCIFDPAADDDGLCVLAIADTGGAPIIA